MRHNNIPQGHEAGAHPGSEPRLVSLKQLCGDKLGAADGEIGHVKDFYFDDLSLAIRYVVADTGSWLSKRQVLLHPHAFGPLQQEGKTMLVNLTTKQIEDSPSIDLHKPVSREHEIAYYRHFGLPYYWDGIGLWGMSGFPIIEVPEAPLANMATVPGVPAASRADAHLRSFNAVNGYHITAADGPMGHVCDFSMHPKSWAIRQIVIKIGHRLSGREVQIPASKVESISYDESTVSVSMTKAEIEQSPAFDLAMANA